MYSKCIELGGNNWSDRRNDDAFEALSELRFSTEGAGDIANLGRTCEGDRVDLTRSHFGRPFLLALAATRKITRGPKPVRALREIGLGADLPADEPTTEGVIAVLERLDLTGRRVGVQLYPGNANERLLKFLEGAGAESEASSEAEKAP